MACILYKLVFGKRAFFDYFSFTITQAPRGHKRLSDRWALVQINLDDMVQSEPEKRDNALNLCRRFVYNHNFTPNNSIQFRTFHIYTAILILVFRHPTYENPTLYMIRYPRGAHVVPSVRKIRVPSTTVLGHYSWRMEWIFDTFLSSITRSVAYGPRWHRATLGALIYVTNRRIWTRQIRYHHNNKLSFALCKQYRWEDEKDVSEDEHLHVWNILEHKQLWKPNLPDIPYGFCKPGRPFRTLCSFWGTPNPSSRCLWNHLHDIHSMREISLDGVQDATRRESRCWHRSGSWSHVNPEHGATPVWQDVFKEARSPVE